MLFVLDNYDSFTFNLVQRFGEIDPSAEIVVRRNDQTTLDEIAELNPNGIVVSPGPCTPSEAGLSKAVIERFAESCPILGVCLGHQSIGEVFGGEVTRASRQMHGKTSPVFHDGEGVFAGLPNPFTATRYHSLHTPEEALPPELVVTAWTEDDEYGREVMGLRHRELPVHGVQFHPESFLCLDGIQLLRNFLAMSGEVAAA